MADGLEHTTGDGILQVIILGAGFDSRGYRFRERLRGMRFLEAGYGPTQEHRKQRVRAALGALPQHVRYVPMDEPWMFGFQGNSAFESLRQAGLVPLPDQSMSDLAAKYARRADGVPTLPDVSDDQQSRRIAIARVPEKSQ